MKIINLNDNENKLYYIGGVVRDEILGLKSFDVDLTYVGNAIEFAKTLKNAEIIKINEPFGTVRVKIDGKEIDIASTRAEIYEKAGHLPTVTKIGCSLKEDVSRRDFTINAMAKQYNSGEITDYTGGLEDIKNKQLRVLHDKSFIDDPTRILRALKFAVRFNFTLEENTKKLRDEYLKNVNYDMSFKRVKKELIETFNLNSQTAYDEFISADIYKLITEKDIQKPDINIEQFVNKYKNLINPQNIWLIYVGTVRDLENLEPTLTKEEKKILDDFTLIEKRNPQNDYDIYKMFEGLMSETVILYGVMENSDIAKHYLDNLKDIKISITGQDLQKLGFEPSKKFGECFEFILKEKIQNKHLTFDNEIELAKKFFE
ncbi:CCA tRNA nucleotidyltransferase [bacterium]|nr:CCA tRNA nucleotidyltransferase [bacterium]